MVAAIPLTTGFNGAREVAGAAGTRAVDAAAGPAEAVAVAVAMAEAEAEAEAEVVSTAHSAKRTPLGRAKLLGRASTDRLARGGEGGGCGGGRPVRSIASSVALSGSAPGITPGTVPTVPAAPAKGGSG